MTKKIFKGITIVSLLALLFALVFVSLAVYEYFAGEIISEMKNEATFIEQGIKQSGLQYLKDLKPSGSRITWIDSDGTVLFDSQADAATMENHSGRAEVQQALQNGSGSAIRYSATLSERMLYYATKLDDGKILRVATEQNTLWALFIGILPQLVLVILAMVVLSAVLASRVSKRIVKPINELDFTKDDITEPYEELTPLIKNLHMQNQQIKAKMEELKQKRQEFSMITENMREGFLIIDQKTDVISYNKSALLLLGTEGSFENQSVYLINRSDALRNTVTEALAGQHSEQILLIASRYVQIIANPVIQNSVVSGAILFVIDVTEKEQRELLRQEFSSNVSHELKTPLTAISGIAEIMENGIVKQEDVPQFAKSIHDESARLIALIDDIIRLSQLDENSLPPEKTAVDLYEAVKNVMERLHPQTSAKSLSVELIGEHVTVFGNAGMVAEIVYNLYDNAIKYNKDGGKIAVTVLEKDGRPILSIRDTGIGIAKEHLERVFERFYRVDKSHSKKIGGTGLGLSIVKHAVHYHGATVKIDSVEGEGTTVTVSFPVQTK